MLILLNLGFAIKFSIFNFSFHKNQPSPLMSNDQTIHIEYTKKLTVCGYIRRIQRNKATTIPRIIFDLILLFTYMGNMLQHWKGHFNIIFPNLNQQRSILRHIENLLQSHKFNIITITQCFDHTFINLISDSVSMSNYKGILVGKNYYWLVLKILTLVQLYYEPSIFANNNIPQWLWPMAFQDYYHLSALHDILILWKHIAQDPTASYFVQLHQANQSVGHTPHWLFRLIINNMTTGHQTQASIVIISNISHILNQLAQYHQVFRSQQLHEQYITIITELIQLLNTIPSDDSCHDTILFNITNLISNVVMHPKQNHNGSFCNELMTQLQRNGLLQHYITISLSPKKPVVAETIFRLISSISIVHDDELRESTYRLLSVDYINALLKFTKSKQTPTKTDILTNCSNLIQSSHKHATLVALNTSYLSFIQQQIKSNQQPNVNIALTCITTLMQHSETATHLILFRNAKIIDTICKTTVESQHYSVKQMVNIYLSLGRLLLINAHNEEIRRLIKNTLKANAIHNILKQLKLISNDNIIDPQSIKMYTSEIKTAHQQITALTDLCH